jgi:uncharacterized protein HemX
MDWMSPRAMIVGAVLVLVGAALGFGVGYKYNDRTSTKTATAGANAQQKQKPGATKPGATKPAAKKSAQTREQLVNCLASHDVRYPTPATANLNSPPPGVDKTKFSTAISACFASLSKSG